MAQTASEHQKSGNGDRKKKVKKKKKGCLKYGQCFPSNLGVCPIWALVKGFRCTRLSVDRLALSTI